VGALEWSLVAGVFSPELTFRVDRTISVMSELSAGLLRSPLKLSSRASRTFYESQPILGGIPLITIFIKRSKRSVLVCFERRDGRRIFTAAARSFVS